MNQFEETKTITLHHGDCLKAMDLMPENSVDAIVTDPPYHFVSIVKRFGKEGSAPAQFGTDGAFARASRGFMGKEWDGGDIAFRPETWAKALRVLKPGGHIVAFGAPKNYHRLACAIEDAGFELRDSLMWVFGTGFPKSMDVSKAIDKASGAEREVIGENPNHRSVSGVSYEGVYAGANTGSALITAPATDEAKQWAGWGTALKPAFEPIVLARKPLSEKTVAANVLRWGTGAINIDGCKVGAGEPRKTQTGGMGRKANPVYGAFVQSETESIETTQGRWPANLAHDGSEEVLDLFPKDAGRFFYSAKANKADRAGSKHPTVKPVALMQWLVRMVTPPGGTILDPFAGSGTTAQAAINEGFNPIIVERESEYVTDIKNRFEGKCKVDVLEVEVRS